MSIIALNKSIEWLRSALNNSKLDNEQQKRELANRGEQIQRLESMIAALKEEIGDPLDEQASSPPESPVCSIKHLF